MTWKLGEEKKTFPPKQPLRYTSKIEKLEQKLKIERTRRLINFIFDLWTEGTNGDNRN